MVTDYFEKDGASARTISVERAEAGGYLAIRSFVVRAFLDRHEDQGRSWRGQVTNVTTGLRRSWNRTDQIGPFIESVLADTAGPEGGSTTEIGELMAAPAMTDVINGMLAALEARLPAPSPPLPAPNVTVERIKESLVGLGRFRGSDRQGSIGLQTLRGVRLDARVRFQLWGSDPSDVDAAVVILHGTMLDAGEQLRLDGFLKLAASETSLAEHVEVVDGWRKTSSYDVVYEFQYEDSDDATGLIARIPIDTDVDRPEGSVRESQTVTDAMVRWDDEGTGPLTITGPSSVGRIEVLAFVPGLDPNGTVTLLRSRSATTTPAVHFPNLATFLAAVSGEEPVETNADVTLSPATFLDAMSPAADPIELGDWDQNAVLDSYERLQLVLPSAIHLAAGTDRFEISHSTPGGLNQQAVLYIRVNAP